MALLYMDGFDCYSTVTQRWPEAHASMAISAGNGRNGAGLRSTNLNLYAYRYVGSRATHVFGFAFRRSSFGTAGSLAVLMDGFGNGSAGIGVNGNGNLYWGTGTGAWTTRATGSTPLSINVWYYVEVKVTIATGATGTLQVKLNGVDEINTSSIITGAVASPSVFGLGQTNGVNQNVGTTTDWDDLYYLDTTGSAPTNDFLGDCKVETLFPTGAGNSTQWAPSAGSNYAAVDESAPNADTDYVSDASVGDKDTYAYGDLAAVSGTVYGLQVLPFARKTDAGTRKIASVARLSGTEVDSADKSLPSSYAYIPDIREAKPGGGVWTISDVNSAEFGVKVTA